MSNEEQKMVTMAIQKMVVTPMGTEIPITVHVSFPENQGLAAIVGLHELAHDDVDQLFDSLVKRGDDSAQVLAGKLLIQQLEEELGG